MIVFSKAAFLLALFPTLLASPHSTAPGASRHASLAVRSAHRAAAATVVAARKPRHASAAAARATERKLLLLASRERRLRRFVDPTTGLVKRNVAAHCTRLRGRNGRYRPHHFLCRVWTLPRRPVSGVAVVCNTAHHGFRVTAYRHRHRAHKSRR